MLGVSQWVAYNLARQGRLPGLVRLGERRLYVKRRVLEAWLQGKDREQKAEVEIWP